MPSEALDRLALLCEQTRHFDRALSLLERLRARDATWPNVATRVESLRKALRAQTTNPDLTPGMPVVDGFDEGSATRSSKRSAAAAWAWCSARAIAGSAARSH